MFVSSYATYQNNILYDINKDVKVIEYPAIMTHASVPPERSRELGIHNNFVRVSVGIECLDDLRADLEQALA